MYNNSVKFNSFDEFVKNEFNICHVCVHYCIHKNCLMGHKIERYSVNGIWVFGYKNCEYKWTGDDNEKN